MSKTSTPTPDELWERAELLYDAADARNGMYDELDAAYDMPEQPAPDGVKFVKTSYFTTSVDLVSDLASQQELTIEVPPRAKSEGAEREADEQEEFLRALVAANDEVQKQNLTGELTHLATQRAACILKVLPNTNTLEKKGDYYAFGGLPYLFMPRDPRYCAWSIGGSGLDLFSERYERRVSEIRSLYPDVLQDETKYPGDMSVDWTEVWTPKYRAYYAASEPVPIKGRFVMAHDYGAIPYALGVGRVIPRMKVRYQPLMRSVANICKNLDTWNSILLTSGWAAITSAWNVFSDSYPVDGSRELNTQPGAVNFFARGDAVQPMQRAPLPSDFFQAGAELRQQLQQATFPFALYGQVEGNMAGYAINMLTQSGRRALAPIWHAVESCYESAFRLVAIIGKHKLEPLLEGGVIPLVIAEKDGAGEGAAETEQTEAGTPKRKRRSTRQVSFKLGNVGDDWQCRVELGDPMPSDEAANLRMAIESTQAGLLSKRTARSRYKLTQDDTAEQEAIQVEKVVDQLAPLEAVRLAQKRGYIPRKLEMPEGFKMLPDGNVVPDLGNEPQPQQQGPQRPEQAGPMPEQMPPELMQMMAQQGQGPSAADMQGLSGQPQFVPGLDEMAGEAPEQLPGMM